MSHQQLVFTPLGTAKTAEDGLLVTSLRIIPTTLLKSVFEHPICFVHGEQVNRTTKNANKAALEYYINTKEQEVKDKLLEQIKKEYVNRDYVFDWEMKDLPLDVVIKYKRQLTQYRNKCLLDYAERKFREYIWRLESESRYIYVRKRDDSMRGLKLLETRYSNSYCRKIEKRMQWLNYIYKRSSCVLLTLTLDPKKFNHDKLLMCQQIKPELNRFMDAMRIYFKRHGRKFPSYIHAVEFQKNGNPHLHVLFFNAARLVDWRKIQKLWGNGFIYINRNKDGEKIHHPVNYVTKYITKTFANVNFDNIRTQSLSWLLGMKSFDRSVGLCAPLNPPSSGDWCLDYLVVMDRLNNTLDEMDYIYRRMDGMFTPSLWDKPPPILISDSVKHFRRWKKRALKELNCNS